MLIELFKRMRFVPIETYQYIGFGSVAFVDFRMVHRSLGISDMTSIEDTNDEFEQARFEHNKPYSCINLKFGKSSNILPQIDFSRRSIVWLDYDGLLSRSISNDLALVASKAKSGSFLAATFTIARAETNDRRSEQFAKLKNDFADLLLQDSTEKAINTPEKFAEFGRAALNALVEKAINDADAGEEDIGKRRLIQQVCFFRYQDGQPMVTVGWIISAQSDLECLSSCNFDALPFVRRSTEPFKIKVPRVTPFEVREMERKLPDLDHAAIEWIPSDARSAFHSIYRYLPQFSVVEQI
jgi:hypothetical protein